MKKLIADFKARDTAANIKILMAELEKLEENSQHKSISMYKIKQLIENEVKELEIKMHKEADQKSDKTEA